MHARQSEMRFFEAIVADFPAETPQIIVKMQELQLHVSFFGVMQPFFA